MRDILRLGIAQITSSHKYEDNIKTLWQAGKAASTTGCDLLALPEVSGLMAADIVSVASSNYHRAIDDPYIAAARGCAQTFDLWLHIGSTPVQGANKLLNHSVLIAPDGEIGCRYNKIHLFDYQPKDNQPLLESSRFSAGTEAVIGLTQWGIWGMSICYDIRFPQLFRDYAKLGARLIFVPSAFTIETGRAHWEPLLRARAIENGCWIVASAQVGCHSNGRQTYGHSMLVSPWGRIVMEFGGEGPEFAAQTINLGEVQAARNQINSIHHDRTYSIQEFESDATQ